MRALRYSTMECRDIDKNIDNKQESGSITLEASIFLVMFIFFYIMFMDLIQLAKTQVILQYSINEVAKQVSTYSYILTKTGIVDKRLGTSMHANEFADKTQKMVDSVMEVGNIFTGGGNGDIAGTFENAGVNVEEYFSDTDELAKGILDLVKTMGADIASDFVIQSLVRSEVEKQLELMSGKSADKYLKDLGIEDGMIGLDFGESKWCNSSTGGMPELEVRVTYTMDFYLGFIELEPRTFQICAKTALW